ncbi:uncharacterized protein LOC124360972 [Homalodisca vitripennis]|uniref:uncharacterized protein LOC124360972 n=1 Tax=Homalodisca vitripennis TaxID=197043 RepID=UPI001EEC25A5|nr:uncharacterized protein LOC124360972 [Homalodisca vitripennis]
MFGQVCLLLLTATAATRCQELLQDQEIVPVPHLQFIIVFLCNGQVQTASDVEGSDQPTGQVKRDTTLGEETPRALYPGTAADLLQGIYSGCLEDGDFSCVKPKVLAFLSASVSQDKIRISRDLSVVRRDDVPLQESQQAGADTDPALASANPAVQKAVRQLMLDRVEDFLATHELRVRVPKELTNPELLAYVPSFLLKNLPQEIRVPLADSAVQGRGRGGMLRKVVIPFLLGLKFKVSALMPLALALIALKTWKALTLGLLSIVLSAAMVIFKITKPKVLNYEVVHLPHPAPVIEHYEHHHGYGRALGAQPLAYRAYFKQ